MSERWIFLSSARAEPQWADRLAMDLDRHGFRVWRDVRHIREGHDFTSEIEDAIGASSHVVVYLTPAVGKDPYSFVRRELQWARC